MDILPAKSGLDHPSRTAPNVAITDNQAIAEQHFDALKSRSFVVFAVTPGQYSPDFSRIIDKIRKTPVGLFDTDHIAIVPLQLLQGRQSLSVDAQRHRFIGAWGYPEFLLNGRHGSGCGCIALKMQAQYYIDQHRFDTANSGPAARPATSATSRQV